MLFTKMHVQWATESGMNSHRWVIVVPTPYGWAVIASLVIPLIQEGIKRRGK